MLIIKAIIEAWIIFHQVDVEDECGCSPLMRLGM